jgi:hypothetical protein
MGQVNPDRLEPPYGPAAPSVFGGWEPEPPRHRPWRRTTAVSAATGAAVALAGAPLGLLWHVLAPAVPMLNTGANGIVVNDPSPEEFIAAEGWFTLLGLGFGVLAAVVAWLLLRRHRGPALLLGVTVGALAAAAVAWQLGRRIGLSAYEAWRETATAGATFSAPPDLHAYGALLVPAFAAAIVLTLLAGWSNDPDLDRPGARPGYGHDLAHAGYPPPAFSSGWPGEPDPTTAPGPPGPGPAGPPHG